MSKRSDVMNKRHEQYVKVLSRLVEAADIEYSYVLSDSAGSYIPTAMGIKQDLENAIREYSKMQGLTL